MRQSLLCAFGRHNMVMATSRLLSAEDGSPNGVLYGSICSCCRRVKFEEIRRAD